MATTYTVDLTDEEEKGSIMVADFVNSEGVKAQDPKSPYVPLSPEELFQQRAKAFCASDYASFSKINIEPLKAKLDKLTEPQRADIEARLKAYVPDVAAAAEEAVKP